MLSNMPSRRRGIHLWFKWCIPTCFLRPGWQTVLSMPMCWEHQVDSWVWPPTNHNHKRHSSDNKHCNFFMDILSCSKTCLRGVVFVKCFLMLDVLKQTSEGLLASLAEKLWTEASWKRPVCRCHENDTTRLCAQLLWFVLTVRLVSSVVIHLTSYRRGFFWGSPQRFRKTNLN